MEMQTDARNGANCFTRRVPLSVQRLVAEILADNETGPDHAANKAALFPLFLAALEKDEDYQRAVDWYAFSNFYDYEATTRNVKPRLDARPAPSTLTPAVEAMKAKIAERILLMEWVLPNGKRLADCTFGELAKLGGWLAKVAKKGKPNQIVGKVLTERQLRAIK